MKGAAHAAPFLYSVGEGLVLSLNLMGQSCWDDPLSSQICHPERSVTESRDLLANLVRKILRLAALAQDDKWGRGSDCPETQMPIR